MFFPRPMFRKLEQSPHDTKSWDTGDIQYLTQTSSPCQNPTGIRSFYSIHSSLFPCLSSKVLRTFHGLGHGNMNRLCPQNLINAANNIKRIYLLPSISERKEFRILSWKDLDSNPGDSRKLFHPSELQIAHW